MLTVRAKTNTKDLKRFITKLDRLKIGPRALVKDMHRLGGAGYKYLKTIIPVSKLNKPHLRNHFKITVVKEGRRLILSITPDPQARFFYAIFLDQGASVPTRYPRTKQAMRFVSKTGEVVFTRKARGFKTSGIHFVRKGEKFLRKNVWKYVDRSLRRYLK